MSELTKGTNLVYHTNIFTLSKYQECHFWLIRLSLMAFKIGKTKKLPQLLGAKAWGLHKNMAIVK